MPGIDNTAGDLPKGANGVPSEQARTATHVPMTEGQIRAVHVGELAPLVGPIQIVDYDPEWPRLFAREAERVRTALGDRVLLLEHVGSTSVPGLAAKPRIDMLLFCNWLRSNASDRELYERTKRELAHKDWKYTQNYADAKTAVVEEILTRARRDAGSW